MEQQERTRRAFEAIIGSRARVAEVMTRKRSLTLAIVRRVRSELGISTGDGMVPTERQVVKRLLRLMP
jgi:HTH-type transcriptional regulator / antitoxin HigA